MRVPDENLEQLRTMGHTVLPGFLCPEELAAAQEGLWLEYPKPDEYFADPSKHPLVATSQFALLRMGPWQSWHLNRLAHHPDLVDLAERLLGSTDLNLYKTELWAKYSGAIDYDQQHHRDFGNHSVVVPKRSVQPQQLTTFLLLSDVGEEDGPTKVVPLAEGEASPYWPQIKEPGAFADVEVAITGPAGTLFAYRTDVLHRGSRMTGERRSRFVLLADYQVWGTRWNGKMAWPCHALNPAWTELMERATPRERELYGFPPAGDAYWDDQTLAGVQARYPGMDLDPYR